MSSVIVVLGVVLGVILAQPSENSSENANENTDILLFDKSSLDVDDVTIKNAGGEYQILGYKYSEEAKADENGNKSQPVRNRIDRHVYAGQLMKPDIEGCKPDPCSFRPGRLYINQLNQHGPQHKCAEKPDALVQISFSFHHGFSFPVFCRRLCVLAA